MCVGMGTRILMARNGLHLFVIYQVQIYHRLHNAHTFAGVVYIQLFEKERDLII